MRWGALVSGIVMVAAVGCAGGGSQTTRLASATTCPRAPMGETMCKHCNCLMPAGVDPDAMCPVCHCKRHAIECRRQ